MQFRKLDSFAGISQKGCLRTSHGGHTNLALVCALVDNVGTTDTHLLLGRADNYIIARKGFSVKISTSSCLTSSAPNWKDKLPVVTIE